MWHGYSSRTLQVPNIFPTSGLVSLGVSSLAVGNGTVINGIVAANRAITRIANRLSARLVRSGAQILIRDVIRYAATLTLTQRRGASVVLEGKGDWIVGGDVKVWVADIWENLELIRFVSR